MDEKLLMEMSTGILRMVYREKLITAEELRKAEEKLRNKKLKNLTDGVEADPPEEMNSGRLTYKRLSV